METTPSDRFVVETPENIRFGYDVADIGSRFLAVLIDSLIQGVLYIVLFLGVILAGSRLATLPLPRLLSDLLAVALVLALFLIQFGYFIFLEIIMSGQTPGKRLFHLRVVKDNGYPLSVLDSLIRNMVRIIDFFPFAYGVGVITMFLNRRAKRLGDFAAGTLVVKMREQVKLSDLRTAPSPAADSVPLFTEGVEQLQERDIAMIESFLQRRGELRNADTLALQMAKQLATRMGQKEVPATGEAALARLREIVNQRRHHRG